MTTPQRLYDEAVMNYEGARAELDAAIKRLGYAEGFEAGKEYIHDLVRDANVEIAEELRESRPARARLADEFATKAIAESFVSARKPKEKTAQELRDDIVERAKADVEAIETGDIFEYAYSYYVVNREKRTVVALIYPVYGNERVEARGIAKCAPNDCFNAHIGKAIALRRALGLTVPDEYLNAPNPTEVRVGDVVKSTLDYPEAVNGPYYRGDTFTIGSSEVDPYVAHKSSAIAENCVVIDDSRE